MLSKRACHQLYSRASRSFATFIATEEFPSKILTRPQAKPLPISKRSTLPNGIEVSSRDCDSAITTVKFSIVSGSRAESPSEKGAAHLLAISAFAGTGKRSGLRLVRDLENLGAKFSAKSDRDKIIYEVKVVSDFAEEAIALLAEAIVSPPAAPYVIGEMKPTAKLFYDKVSETPLAQLSELLHEAAFGEATPLGSSLLAADLEKLDVADVLSFRNAHFTAGNVTVSASNISHDALEKALKCFLSPLPAGKTVVPASPYIGGDFKIRAKLGGNSYLGLAFPVPAGEAAKPYRVLHEIISSKVAALKLPKDSLVPVYHQYSTGGIFGFLASGTPAQATGRLEAGVAELKAVAAAAVVDGAKKKVSLDYFLAVESTGSADLSLSDVRDVTASSVQSAASAALSAVPSYAVLGTTLGTPSYASILKLVK